MISGFDSAMGPPCDILSPDERTSQAALIAAGMWRGRRGRLWPRGFVGAPVGGVELVGWTKTFLRERRSATAGSRRRSQASVRLARRVTAIGEQPLGARVDHAFPVRERGLGELTVRAR